MTRLSVVIVNYNAGTALAGCLDALAPQLADQDEVFIVDNASSDGSAEPFDGRPGVNLVRNVENLGFARACNQALERAHGRFLLLLNPDAQVAPRALDTALRYMEANPDVGILGPRILRPGGRLDPAARRSFKTPATYFYKLVALDRLFPRSRAFGHYYLSYLPEDRLADVDSVVGAFLLIRRSVVDTVGHLDERFFMYCEDEDWCWRVKQAGFRVVYNPALLVHHVKGLSSTQRRIPMAYHWHRSVALYHRKNIASRYPGPVNGAVYALIAASLASAVVVATIRTLGDRLRRKAPPPRLEMSRADR